MDINIISINGFGIYRNNLKISDRDQIKTKFFDLRNEYKVRESDLKNNKYTIILKAR